MKKNLRRRQYHTKKVELLGIKIPLVALLVLITLFISNVFCAIESGALGSELIALETKTYEIKNLNREINEQLLSKSSLTKIEEEMLSSEMVKPKQSQLLYMNRSEEVARLQ